MIRFLISLAATLFFAGVCAAEQGNVESGKAAAVTCVACHATSNSVSAQFPNLSGQVPGYIAAQLAKFKSGERKNAIMAPMVAPLSAQDMADLDAYYSSLSGIKGAITPAQEEDALAGGKLYRGGYKPYNIPACMGCHGPSGYGIPPAFPRLSGQSAAYIEAQLLVFKSAARRSPIMNPIAFSLSEQQIKQLALYISALY